MNQYQVNFCNTWISDIGLTFMIKPIKLMKKLYILEINVSATTVTKNCVKLTAKCVDGKESLEDVSFWYKKLSDLKLLEDSL